jgi:hypothetical protein
VPSLVLYQPHSIQGFPRPQRISHDRVRFLGELPTEIVALDRPQSRRELWNGNTLGIHAFDEQVELVLQRIRRTRTRAQWIWNKSRW